jgi:hypothetical protein
VTSSSGRTPRGRRDNGLDAPEYAAAADVDPRVGEHLLDVLALANIAAYLQPSADLHPVTRTTTLPNRPTDRLWVDRRHLDEARKVISRLDLGTGSGSASAGDEAAAGEPGDPAEPGTDTGGSASRRRRRDDLDIDAAWQQILASWDAPTTDPPRPPGTGRVPDDADAYPHGGPGRNLPREPGRSADRDSSPPHDSAHRDGSPRSDGPGVPPAPDDAESPGARREDDDRREPWRGRPVTPEPIVGLDVPFDEYETVRDPEDEGYVPPAPPPLPRVSRYTVLATVLILAGLALFFRPHLLPATESTALLTGMACIVAGCGTLIWRLRDGLTDDDPDDGAVV